jgi:uncharacterized membrane protein YphA (DoxX/SURF4 family)
VNKLGAASSVFLRLALGVSFLAAVVDRFGFLGIYGQPNVARGDFAHFLGYTAKLNWFVPAIAVPTLAWGSTLAETLLGFSLILGWFTRFSALLSGILLLLFALVMTSALGLKAPLNYSVFSASAGAFLLSSCPRFPWSLDAIRIRASS